MVIFSGFAGILLIFEDVVFFFFFGRFKSFQEKFKEFRAEGENQLGKHIKAIRSDRGGEYLLEDFKDYLTQNGIVSQLTAPRTPQQNGEIGRAHV